VCVHGQWECGGEDGVVGLGRSRPRRIARRRG
jgi:hypothetical protein